MRSPFQPPTYKEKNGKIRRTIFHEDGPSLLPDFERKGDKIYPTIFNSKENPIKVSGPAFELTAPIFAGPLLVLSGVIFGPHIYEYASKYSDGKKDTQIAFLQAGIELTGSNYERCVIDGGAKALAGTDWYDIDSDKDFQPALLQNTSDCKISTDKHLQKSDKLKSDLIEGLRADSHIGSLKRSAVTSPNSSYSSEPQNIAVVFQNINQNYSNYPEPSYSVIFEAFKKASGENQLLERDELIGFYKNLTKTMSGPQAAHIVASLKL